jgi:hypothetical protein
MTVFEWSVHISLQSVDDCLAIALKGMTKHRFARTARRCGGGYASLAQFCPIDEAAWKNVFAPSKFLTGRKAAMEHTMMASYRRGTAPEDLLPNESREI